MCAHDVGIFFGGGCGKNEVWGLLVEIYVWLERGQG